MKIDVTRIYELSKKENKIIPSIDKRILKMVEELGELAGAQLCKDNSFNKSKSSHPDTLEEGVDALICDLDVLFGSEYSLEQIQEMIDKKVEKWAKKFDLDAESQT